MNIIVLGAPGAGKGTQAKLLAKHFGLTHISSGEQLRLAAQKDTAKGRLINDLITNGQLLPFDTVLDVIMEATKSAENGFILDGTPRDLPQAESLDYVLNQEKLIPDHVLFYTLPDDVARQRLLKRAQSSGRSDDTPQTIAKRLKIYHQETEPVVDYYRRQGKLIEIDARPSIEEIFQATLQKLK